MKHPQHKIFCIGLNKTGTTSVGDAFGMLGYRRLGWRDDLSGQLIFRWHEGKYEKFHKISLDYEMFEDLPWCFLYEEMDRLYPNAKFILTRRSSPEKWYNSLVKHVDRRGGNWVGHYLIYGTYDLENNKEEIIDFYNEHNDKVKKYFSSREDKLLELCLEEGDGWEAICDFLGVDEYPDMAFPHSNKAT